MPTQTIVIFSADPKNNRQTDFSRFPAVSMKVKWCCINTLDINSAHHLLGAKLKSCSQRSFCIHPSKRSHLKKAKLPRDLDWPSNRLVWLADLDDWLLADPDHTYTVYSDPLKHGWNYLHLQNILTICRLIRTMLLNSFLSTVLDLKHLNLFKTWRDIFQFLGL